MRQVAEGEAALALGASFMAGAAEDLGDRPRLSGFPPDVSGGERPMVVGGDAAVVMKDSSRGERFVTWLTREDAMVIWSNEDAGWLTPNKGSPYRTEPEQDRADYVHIWFTEAMLTDNVRLHFDLSDQIEQVTGEGTLATLDIFEDFFDDVTRESPNTECAIGRVIDRLNAVAEGREGLPGSCG